MNSILRILGIFLSATEVTEATEKNFELQHFEIVTPYSAIL